MKEDCLQEIEKRFGCLCLGVHRAGMHKWRVSVDGWHVHLGRDSASTIYGNGSGPEEAAENLLQRIDGRIIGKSRKCTKPYPKHSRFERC